MARCSEWRRYLAGETVRCSESAATAAQERFERTFARFIRGHNGSGNRTDLLITHGNWGGSVRANSAPITMSIFEPYRPRRASTDVPAPLAGLQIRLAVPDDVRQLCAIEAERMGGDPAALLPLIERSVASVNPDRLTLVAEHDHAVVGFGRAGYFRPAEDAPANVAPCGWYLAGLVVATQHRRRGAGRVLTRARLDWIAKRDDQAFYFANARNVVSIQLHREFGFVEVTRDFTFPGASFEGGVGVLFRAVLAQQI